MSREKQIEEMAKCCIYHKDGMCVIDKDISYCDLMCKMFGFITNLYNAGYRKQKEGEWVEHETDWGDTYYSCSVCGDERCTIDGTIWEHSINYCPNCGAKMKGGAE